MAAALLAGAMACRRPEKPGAAAPPPAKPTPAAALRFDEKAQAIGIDFVHINGARGQKWMPETMGGGVAVLDYDGDGRPDLLFVSGAWWPGDPRAASQKSSLALYHNEGNGPDGLPRFRDATREAGLRRTFQGMGAAVGDYDNDGRPDVYVTAVGRNFLFHNAGGRFEEVSGKARVRDSGWGTSAVWLDYDGDGLLDLFVCRYVDWSPKTDLFCTLDGKTKSYCTPERYPGTSSHLYRNLGNGCFEDVTRKAGLWNVNQKALGAAAWDVNGDGRPDLFVSNDTAPNNLYRNRGDGTFEDVAVEAGVAVDEAGRSRGSMGAAWGDTRNGKGATLAVGNFSNELKSLYWTETGDVFLDESPRSGVGSSSLLSLTFGLFFFDADLDGRLDLFLANGHVEPSVQEVQKTVTYRQAPVLYRNLGDNRFAAATGGDLATPIVGRGAVYADLDGDGDLDIVVVENGGPARVFVNRLDRPDESVRVRLVGTDRSNRDAIGARVTARIGSRSLTSQVSGGESYLSAPEKTLTFGLGGARRIDSLEIRWPDGRRETLGTLAGGTLRTVTEGSGAAPAPSPPR
ncbi:MAG: CRTAC1 family protein [Acidobacteria bacterium]|nr:CRTAC1 family protein [Acidobacteriota bacterium]MCA1610301.1 CRTAC1 family protein [Acidobacteriota bacterium]